MATSNVDSRWLVAIGAIGLTSLVANPARAGDAIIQSCRTRVGYVDYVPTYYGSRSLVRYAEPVVVDYSYPAVRHATYSRRPLRSIYRSDYVAYPRAPIRYRPIYVERRYHPRGHFSVGFDYVRPRRYEVLPRPFRFHRGRHLHGRIGLYYGRYGHHGRHRGFSFHIGR